MKKTGLLIIALLYNALSFSKNYDTFIVNTVEGIPMTFFVYNENYGKVIVGGRSGSNTSPTLNAISTSTQGVVTIPDEVEYNGKTYSVVQIGENAFKNCSSVTTFNIPETVSLINKHAFAGCTSIESISILGVESLYSAFENCTSLKSVELGNQLSYIAGSFSGCTALTSIVLPGSLQNISSSSFEGCTNLESVTIGDDLVIIGDKAFANCSKLENLTLPETITYIGERAFENCSTFTSITLPSNLKYIKNSAFKGCTGITSITIPGKVLSIEDDAFTGCNLTKVVLEDGSDDLTLGYNASLTSGSSYKGLFFVSSTPQISELYIGRNIVCTVPKPFRNLTSLTTVRYGNTVNTIEEGEFTGCSFLSTVEFGNGLTTISKDAFNGCSQLTSIDLHNAPVHIGQSAFEGCSALKSASIGTSVKSIGSKAFYMCSSLESIDIPDSNGGLGEYAFANCYNLKSVKIGNGVYSIGWHAFENCSDISSLTLGNCIVEIGLQAFYGCRSLKEVVIPASTSTLKANVFNGCSSLEKVTILGVIEELCGFSYCTALKSITIPEGTKKINDNTFSGCKSLETISLPNSITSIGQYVFYRCTSLKSIKMPSNLNTLGKYAFQECALTSIIIPPSLTSIGDEAFKGCSSLTSVTAERTTPASIKDNVFADVIANATLYVSYGSKSAYQKNSVWNKFKSIVESRPIIGSTFSYYLPCGGDAIECRFSVTETDPMEVQVGNGTMSAINATMNDNLTVPSIVYGHDDTSFRVTNIAEYAFYNRTMPSVTLSEGILSISKNAFNNCSELTTLNIPISVTRIDNAFTGCTSLNSLTVGWRKPSDIEVAEDNFEDIPSDAVLSVPAGTKKYYETLAPWNKFSQIVEVSPISLGDITAGHESIVDLSIILNSPEEIAGVQFKLTLPEGVSLTEENGYPIVTLTNRTEGFTALGSKDPDASNSYLFLLFSMDGKSIIGNEGAIMNLKLDVSNSINLGTHDMIIDDVHLATSTFETLYPDASTSNLSVTDYIIGDANNDGVVSIADVTAIINKINNNVSSTFAESAADVNGDGLITIADVTGVINIINK